MTRRRIGRQAQMLLHRPRRPAHLGEGRDHVHVEPQLGARRTLGDDRQGVGRIRPVDPGVQRDRRQLQRHALQRPAQRRGIREHPPLQHHRGGPVLQISQHGLIDRLGIIPLDQGPQIPRPAFGIGRTRGEDRLDPGRPGVEGPRRQMVRIEVHQRLDRPILERLLGGFAPFEGGGDGEAHAAAHPSTFVIPGEAQRRPGTQRRRRRNGSAARCLKTESATGSRSRAPLGPPVCAAKTRLAGG
mgnify:CR=1 FL=1